MYACVVNAGQVFLLDGEPQKRSPAVSVDGEPLSDAGDPDQLFPLGSSSSGAVGLCQSSWLVQLTQERVNSDLTDFDKSDLHLIWII